MIGRVPVHPGVESNYFGQFMTNFPTRLDRLKHARELVDGGWPSTYRTRSVLSSLWHDDNRVVRDRARDLYDLKNTADIFVGQTVLNFIGCTPKDIESLGTDNPKPLYVEVFGVANNRGEAGMSHTFEAAPPEYHEMDRGLTDAKAIRVKSSLRTHHWQSIGFNPDTGLSVMPAMEGTLDVPVMSTTTCLEFDSALYDRTKVIGDGSLMFGNRRSFKFLQAMATYAGGSVNSNFRDLARAGEIMPNRSLPDLEPLVA